MPTLTTTVFGALRAAERVSPALAARLAEPVFQSTRPAARVRPADRAMHDIARRGTLRVRGREIRTYEWGRGAQTILLVHGWRGRASQFATLVRELRSEGYRLIAFDAPASGDSAGRRTDIRDWLAAIEELQQRHGRFHSIIGHSFGGLAALTAVREGAATDGVVTIAGMGDARYLVDGFGALSGLRAPTTDALADWFADRIMPGHPDPWGRFDATADPLPGGLPLLLVHDRNDREVAADQSLSLHAAHGERSRLVLTSGAGHNAVLGADPTLDAITAFAVHGLAGVDATGLAGVAATGIARPAATEPAAANTRTPVS